MALEKKPADMDVGDWMVVAFLFAFAAIGAAYIFAHPSRAVFGLWIGTLATSGGIFHWLRIRDSKQADAASTGQ